MIVLVFGVQIPSEGIFVGFAKTKCIMQGFKFTQYADNIQAQVL